MVYVGKTIREFRRRILEHIGDIEHQRETPLASHMRIHHSSNPLALKFWALEIVSLGERKGNLDRLLLQKEAGWIYRLKTTQPHGINDILSFAPFL